MSGPLWKPPGLRGGELRRGTQTEAPEPQEARATDSVIRVYVSASRRDVRWFRKGSLITAVSRYLETRNAGLWYDQRRFLGERASRRRSEGAIDTAHIALVLISRNSLESPFIQTVELPRIEYRVVHEGLVVIPLLLEDCDWESLPLPSVVQKQRRKPKPLSNYLRPKERWNSVLNTICGVVGRHIDELRHDSAPWHGAAETPEPVPTDSEPSTKPSSAESDHTGTLPGAGPDPVEPDGMETALDGAFPLLDQDVSGGDLGDLLATAHPATGRLRTGAKGFILPPRGALPEAGDLEAPSPDTPVSVEDDSSADSQPGEAPQEVEQATPAEDSAVPPDQLEFGAETYRAPAPPDVPEEPDLAPEPESLDIAPEPDIAAEETPTQHDVPDAPEPEALDVSPEPDITAEETPTQHDTPEASAQEEVAQPEAADDWTDLLEWETEQETTPVPASDTSRPIVPQYEPERFSTEETVQPPSSGQDSKGPDLVEADAGRADTPPAEAGAPAAPQPHEERRPADKTPGILGGWMKKMRGALSTVGGAREGSIPGGAGGEVPYGEVPYIDPRAHERLGRATPRTPEGDLDIVDCTAFAPETVQQVEPFLVQVFLHTPEQANQAAARAARRPAAATRRAVKSLEAELARGSQVVLSLAMPGVRVDDPVQAVVWDGVPEAALFSVIVPLTYTAETLAGTVTVSLGGIPIGHVRFELEVIDTFSGREPSRDMVAIGDDAHRYSRAFLSYAPEDGEAVLSRAADFKALGMELAECTSVEDSDAQGQETLHSRIDDTDLLVLCWSEAASLSDTVRREVGYVLERGKEGLAAPAIHPVAVGQPPLPGLWEEIGHIHFSDAPEEEVGDEQH
jgi:hypothetical protein